MNMQVEKDSRDQKYIEVPWSDTESLRVTHVPESWSGRGGIRVQVRQEDGHLRQGPEIPVDKVGDIVSAVINLMREGGSA